MACVDDVCVAEVRRLLVLAALDETRLLGDLQWQGVSTVDDCVLSFANVGVDPSLYVWLLAVVGLTSDEIARFQWVFWCVIQVGSFQKFEELAIKATEKVTETRYVLRKTMKHVLVARDASLELYARSGIEDGIPFGFLYFCISEALVELDSEGAWHVIDE